MEGGYLFFSFRLKQSHPEIAINFSPSSRDRREDDARVVGLGIVAGGIFYIR
jgi:hypothetical protein